MILHGSRYRIELPTLENTLLAFDPISRIAPTTNDKDHREHDRVLSDVLSALIHPESAHLCHTAFPILDWKSVSCCNVQNYLCWKAVTRLRLSR
jgi:hypothetical protein